VGKYLEDFFEAISPRFVSNILVFLNHNSFKSIPSSHTNSKEHLCGIAAHKIAKKDVPVSLVSIMHPSLMLGATDLA
jgi:hypothetical protein